MIYLWTALVAFTGSFTQSCSGFGNAIICMALWPLLMPFRTASVLEAITAFFMVVYITLRLYRHINLKLLLPPLISSTLFSFLGVSTLMTLSDRTMKQILGVALLLLAVYFVFFSHKVKLKPSLTVGLLAGVVSGFFGGLFNIGGPPMVAYFLSVTDDKMEYNASLQAYFAVTTITIFAFHLFMGNVTVGMLPLGCAALAGTVAGTLSGMSVFRRLSIDGVKRIVYAFMVVAGIYMLIFAQ